MYYVCETLKMLENVVKRSKFGYTREQRYTKFMYYYYQQTDGQLETDTQTYIAVQMDRQTDGQTESRQTDRYIDGQMDRQMDRKTEKQLEGWIFFRFFF